MADEAQTAPYAPATNGNGDPALRLTRSRWTQRPFDEQPPVRWRELAALLVAVVLYDLAIYRGHGLAGYAAVFLLSPILLVWGAFRPRTGGGVWATGIMLFLLAAKTAWCGSPLQVAAGFALLAAYAMALSGQTPFVAETAVFTSQSISSGYKRLLHYGRSMAASSLWRLPLINVGLPLLAFVVFGTVFVLANPDLVASFSEALEQLVKQTRQWLLRLSAGEMGFWIAVLWLAAGLLRQASASDLPANELVEPAEAEEAMPLVEPARLYPAFRNTLLTVIVLFAVYLVFEIRTLWFREFPKGFYYSGYAHEGAAWLTFALALATAVLSLVFRGPVMHDPRLPRLRRLGWLWSAENLVLAVAVYHRLAIYIGFNGMSPMRMVGLYGMTAVVLGFLLVLWKIARARSFGWLVRRQLCALAIVVYLFALTPVDAIVTEYNVRRILTGDPAPSVQISVHQISAEGVVPLEPLLRCDDAIIRDGVAAMLAQRDDEAEALAARRQAEDWTSFQWADVRVLERFRADRASWTEYRDQARRQEALKRFHDYAYQWF